MTADPEMQTIGENRLCKITIACDCPKRKYEDKSESDFFNCAAWNRYGDTVASWFKKGDMITRVGEVHINRYEKDGQKRSATEVKIEEIHFSGNRKAQPVRTDIPYSADNLPF